jgi:hypothetical protein
MEVLVKDGEPSVAVDPKLDGEPFAVLAPLFAHEGFHQDLAVALHEEVIATYLETLVWGEHLLAAPALARLGTSKARRANTMLLLVLNSGGRSFPRVGLHTAPHRQETGNAIPGGSGWVPNFAAAVESRYLQTLPGSSPGVAYARNVIERVTGIADATFDFDVETLALLDERTDLFSADELVALLGTLELQPATETVTAPMTAVGDADPVALADARFERDEQVVHADVGLGRGDCGTCLQGSTPVRG